MLLLQSTDDETEAEKGQTDWKQGDLDSNPAL